MDVTDSRPAAAEPEAFSVCDCDQYLAYLCAVSMQEQLVLATEDVHNQFGILLLRQGTPLGSHALQRLQSHRLNRPLDELFALRLAPAASAIAEQASAMSAAEPELAAVSRITGQDEKLRMLCERLALPHVLLQKLAVMQRVLPRVHHRALFTAWMGTALGSGRALPDEDLRLVLLAALLHDIGFLHMPPELSARRGEISSAEWSALKEHPRRSAEVIAQSWPEAPPRVLRIVAEHHERHDGAGYPAGKPGAEQDPLSGIIALADMLHALRFDTGPERMESIAECLPFLRVNRRTWGIENYRPAARILLEARGVTPPQENTTPLSLQGLMDANRSLGRIVGAIPDARAVLESLQESRRARSLTELLAELERVARAAGLGTETLSSWLHDNLRQGRTDPGQEEVALTIKESLWLVRRIDRTLRELLQERQGEADAPRLKDLSLLVRSELTRAWRRFEHRN